MLANRDSGRKGGLDDRLQDTDIFLVSEALDYMAGYNLEGAQCVW